jgi:hypothetical protein
MSEGGGQFLNENTRRVAGEIAGSGAVIGLVGWLAYAWWTAEPEPRDYCADLRSMFAEKVEAEDLKQALDRPAQLVVVDTPDAEDGLPCDVILVGVEEPK